MKGGVRDSLSLDSFNFILNMIVGNVLFPEVMMEIFEMKTFLMLLDKTRNYLHHFIYIYNLPKGSVSTQPPCSYHNILHIMAH